MTYNLLTNCKITIIRSIGVTRLLKNIFYVFNTLTYVKIRLVVNVEVFKKMV